MWQRLVVQAMVKMLAEPKGPKAAWHGRIVQAVIEASAKGQVVMRA